MAFVLDTASSYSWPVEFDIPGDGGRRVRQSFDAEFDRVDQAECEEIIAGVRQREALQEAGQEVPDELERFDPVAIARRLMVGWGGIKDANGEEVPFTDATVMRVLRTPTVAVMIVRAWVDSLAGKKSKNSLAPRGIG
jgi:hypothetical protein